jgi:hypothetical protein
VSGGASIDALSQAFHHLRDALDKDDAGAILEASRVVTQAVSQVQSHGGWRSSEELAEKLSQLAVLMEATRLRINLASDHVRKRITMLSEHGSAEARIVYSR